MLEIQDIEIGYGNLEVARFEGGYAFAQSPSEAETRAEFITIIGPNGSGKSTLINALTTGDNLLKGKVIFNGKPIDHYGQELSRQIAVVRTRRDFSMHLTVQEMLEFSQTYQTETVKSEILSATLNDFDLNSLAKKRLGNLSDGQLQRALVARAVVQDTPFLIMDEPTSHLDINHKTDLLLQLKSYCSTRQKTIIFSSHEIELSLELADLVIAIFNGKITIHKKLDFIKTDLLNQMFPSAHLEFKDGKVRFIA